MQQNKQTSAVLAMRIVFTFFLIATMLFIFANSAQIGEISALRSAKATEIINNIFFKINVNVSLSQHVVRKLGHFAEYFLLGFWLMLTLRVYTHRLLAFIAWPLLLGLLTATVDEFLQTMVAGRSGQVTDIIIDFAGVLLGLCVALFIQLLVSAIVLSFKKKQ